MADKECNYKNNDHCTIDTNYCAPNNTGQHCFIRKYADERQENKALKAENERLRKASKMKEKRKKVLIWNLRQVIQMQK